MNKQMKDKNNQFNQEKDNQSVPLNEKQKKLIDLSNKIKSENSAYYFHGGSGFS